MRNSKTEALGRLVWFINQFHDGNKTISYMTALLLSWEGMDATQVAKIVNEACLVCATYESQTLAELDI